MSDDEGYFFDDGGFVGTTVLKVKGINCDVMVSVSQDEAFIDMEIKFPKYKKSLHASGRYGTFDEKQPCSFKSIYRALNYPYTEQICELLTCGFGEAADIELSLCRFEAGMEPFGLAMELVGVGVLHRLWLFHDDKYTDKLAFKEEVIKETMKWDDDPAALVTDFVELSMLFDGFA
eukprot:TRINITY_DN71981_c0_g1_i1.p1 TRINITY_DN71981_c0_g1~~TRINITY_DN71981_c0_g1_i1.p1  ORF type:complete len:176 (+),score=30.05 TRINITY_DN71981_c0_g1_i1:204-731(+)